MNVKENNDLIEFVFKDFFEKHFNMVINLSIPLSLGQQVIVQDNNKQNIFNIYFQEIKGGYHNFKIYMFKPSSWEYMKVFARDYAVTDFSRFDAYINVFNTLNTTLNVFREANLRDFKELNNTLMMGSYSSTLAIIREQHVGLIKSVFEKESVISDINFSLHDEKVYLERSFFFEYLGKKLGVTFCKETERFNSQLEQFYNNLYNDFRNKTVIELNKFLPDGFNNIRLLPDEQLATYVPLIEMMKI